MSPWSNHNSGRCVSQHMAHCKAGFDNCSRSSNLVGIGITSNLNKWELIPKLGLYVCIFLQHRAACKYIAFSLYFHALSAVFPDSWPLYFCKGKRIYHGHTEMYGARHIVVVQTSLNWASLVHDAPELHRKYTIVYNLEQMEKGARTYGVCTKTALRAESGFCETLHYIDVVLFLIFWHNWW